MLEKISLEEFLKVSEGKILRNKTYTSFDHSMELVRMGIAQENTSTHK